MRKTLMAVVIRAIGCCALSTSMLIARDAQAALANPAAVSAEDSDTTPYNLVLVVMDFTVSFRLPSRAPGLRGHVFALDALQLVHLYAERGSPKSERAALRWLRRYLDEHDPSLVQFARVAGALAKKIESA